MGKTTNSVIFSDAEREILELALQKPELSNSEIAEQTGYRLTLIRDTRQQYEDDVTLPEDLAEAATEEGSTDDSSEPLSKTQQVILELVAENPQITNAELAEQTGARLTLVRDTRDVYGHLIDTQQANTDSTETDDTDPDSPPSVPDEPSAVQQDILEVAAEDSSLSNADIADQTNARVTLVRDTLDQYDVPSDTGEETTADQTAEIDTQNWSDAQLEILEAAAANPEATNREIARQTWSRITLVRDTLAAYESDDTETTDDSSGDSDGEPAVLEAVDTAAFSGTQIRILEAALSNPELTTAEIAAKTDTRITLVRDTIYEHEYDEKPWVGNVEEQTDDKDNEDGEAEDTAIIVDDDDEIELPDTTASDVFSDRQRAILETALENPELTNREIADRTGGRLPLVRDTRDTYEDGVELAEDDSDETASRSSTAEPTFTEKQQQIIVAATENEEASIAELAEQTASRIPLVRDTLRVADVSKQGAETTTDTGSVDEPTATDNGNEDAESADQTTTDEDVSADGKSTADTTAEDMTDKDDPDKDDGLSDEMLVAIAIIIILHFAVIAMLL